MTRSPLQKVLDSELWILVSGRELRAVVAGTHDVFLAPEGAGEVFAHGTCTRPATLYRADDDLSSRNIYCMRGPGDDIVFAHICDTYEDLPRDGKETLIEKERIHHERFLRSTYR